MGGHGGRTIARGKIGTVPIIRFRVYADAKRQGFEIFADEAGRICGRKFVPWSFEPRYGIDVQDLAAIERATEDLLEELA
jgi:hypothetical protein